MATNQPSIHRFSKKVIISKHLKQLIYGLAFSAVKHQPFAMKFFSNNTPLNQYLNSHITNTVGLKNKYDTSSVHDLNTFHLISIYL